MSYSMYNLLTLCGEPSHCFHIVIYYTFIAYIHNIPYSPALLLLLPSCMSLYIMTSFDSLEFKAAINNLRLVLPNSNYDNMNQHELDQLFQACEDMLALKPHPEEEEFVVERIIKCQKRQGVKWYLLKWEGNDETTWEPESNMKCDELLSVFHNQQRRRSARLSQ